MRIKKRLAATMLALGAFLVPLGLTASPAQAAVQGNVYVAFPKWLGNCPNGGSVTAILADNSGVWSTTRWDTGDDLIYPRVNMNTDNRISYTVFCKTTWYGAGYYQPGYSVTIRPTRNGQTFWVGPLGQSRN